MVNTILLLATLRMFGSVGAESQLSPANADSPLNPHNVAGLPYTTNSADAALYADAKTERVKAHVKLRADASDRAADHVQLGEGFVQANLRPWLDVTAGRVIEKWGTGYAWNPVAFVSPQKNPTDPTDRRSAYRGVDMVRADAFVHDTNVSLYALRDHAVAARVYRLVGGTDVSLHFRRDTNGTQQGLSAAHVFGDALELHGEATRRHLLLGGQYTFPANVNVVAEVYRSGEGLTAAQWQAFRDSVSPTSLYDANMRFAPMRMARNYAFARADAPFGKNGIEVLTITNLRDGSSIARATYTRKLRPNLSAYVIETEFLGQGEMSYIQLKRLTTFGARVYF
ncbi:MAG TPA: hypothetical protein VG323_20970 [Thermoanaerobaculia bacterium]|nr:hypothetical protein [Thermoanaerobaculia bacterium]